MRPDDSPSELHPELLDDFYAECDDLFGQMRVFLDALETAVDEGLESTEGLYRAVHSFKGICGIVGLRLAEELAHAAEDVLRHFTSVKAPPPRDTLALFARTLARLEQIVAAHRLRAPLPAIEDLLAPLRAFQPGAANKPTPGARPDHAAAILWLARFTPSAELAARGVNVTAVRARLTALGALEKSEPSVLPGGGIAFDFAVRLKGPPPDDLAAWLADGVALRPADPAIAQDGLAPASFPPATASTAPASSAAVSSTLSIAPSHIVRVDMSRLDELMRIMGELVIHRSRLEERIARLGGEHDDLQEVNLALSRSLRDLRSAITRVRMVPMAEIFARLPFVLRDLAQEQKKSVRLVVQGQETEIDKYLVERLKEPLLHLVRNAVSHGVESPSERAAAGKAPEASLTLRASTTGHAVLLTVEDDGRGIDVARVAARAKASGLAVPDAPTDAEILAVLCHPGFSTRDEADLASGRGVGMDVVHTTLRELGGVLTLETAPGRFTRFTLRLPLTLSIIDTFIVSSADQTCAVPRALVEEIIQFEEADVRPVKQTEVIPYRDGVLPVVRLDRFLGVTARTKARVPALVMASERGLSGLVVDRVHAHREVVVRPMSDPLLHVPGIAGATELGDGRPVLILDPTALSRGAVRPRGAPAPSPSPASP